MSLSVEEPLMWMPEFTISCAAEAVVERATTTLYSFNLAIVSTVTWVKLGLSVGSGGFHFLTVNMDVTARLQCFDAVGWAAGRASGL